MKQLIFLALIVLFSCKKNEAVAPPGEWDTNKIEATYILSGLNAEWKADWNDRMFCRAVQNGGISSLITISGRSGTYSINIDISNIFTPGVYQFGEGSSHLQFARLSLIDWRDSPHLYHYINNRGIQSGKLIIDALDYYNIKGRFDGKVYGDMGMIEIIDGRFEGVFHY